MKKYTSLERAWILYDVGNSAFTLLVSTIIPIYFNYLAEEAGLSSVTYLAYWGYAAPWLHLRLPLSGRYSAPWLTRRITRNRFSLSRFWWE